MLYQFLIPAKENVEVEGPAVATRGGVQGN